MSGSRPIPDREPDVENSTAVGGAGHAGPVQRVSTTDPSQMALLDVSTAPGAGEADQLVQDPIGRYVVRDLAAELASNPDLVRRFWEKVWTAGEDDSPDQCWLWIGSLSGGDQDGLPRNRGRGSGYGGAGYGNLHIRYDKHPVTGVLVEWIAYAHHIAWLLEGNPEPEPGQVRRHTCDERSCARGSHLVVGTRSDNYWDYRNREFAWHGPLNDPRGPSMRAREIKAALLAAGVRDLRVLLAPDSHELAEQRAAVAAAQRAGHDRVGQGTLLPEDELSG